MDKPSLLSANFLAVSAGLSSTAAPHDVWLGQETPYESAPCERTPPAEERPCIRSTPGTVWDFRPRIGALALEIGTGPRGSVSMRVVETSLFPSPFFASLHDALVGNHLHARARHPDNRVGSRDPLLKIATATMSAPGPISTGEAKLFARGSTRSGPGYQVPEADSLMR
ncbi:hypothetical protein LA080_011142 [Diaporthe eres]|nr:hypothetical protein LA080_011142 [Diaporthe eres]